MACLYYRPNYLYIRYSPNGGTMSSSHGSGYGTQTVDGIVYATYTGNTVSTEFLRGFYGGTVNGFTLPTYSYPSQDGLHDVHNRRAINFVKTGYTTNASTAWNTKADGTGTSYSQSKKNYTALQIAGNALKTGDVVITLYANWVPNPLVFDDQSVILNYTNTNTQTWTFTGASNGTGSYTYEITPAVSGFSISGTTITVAQAQPSGKYTVPIKATDSVSGSAKTATMTITITRAIPTVVISSKTVKYSGSAISIGTAQVTGVSGMPAPSGTVSYTYYTDPACTDATRTTTSTGASTVGGAPKNVGKYYVIARVEADSNYEIGISETATLEITKRAITITAKDQNLIFGDSIATGASQVIIAGDGLASGQTISAITLTPNTDQVTNNGTITPSNATISASSTNVTSNYNITYASGKLVISSGSMVVTATGYTNTYDGNGHTITVTAPSGTTIKYGTTNGNYNLTAPPEYIEAGTYTIYYQASKPSYETVTGSAVVKINKRNITITAKPQTIGVQGSLKQDDSQIQITGSGLATGDILYYILLTPSTLDRTTNGTITPSGTIIKRAEKDTTANYNITYVPGVLTVTDLTPPKGSIEVQNTKLSLKGKEGVSSNAVDLKLNAEDPESNVVSIALTNENARTASDINWEAWNPNSGTNTMDKSWSLSTGDGDKTVYMMVKNADGLITVTFVE